ncbi:MAG: bifunctional phosphopantothenoylcysteine decarboxylase/phosphopantothenate--cysteine ligase CoaBC, partial [Thermoprotei archaeon]
MSSELGRYHTVEEIRSAISSELEGKKVVLGVTGSVAAYKAVDVARRLIRLGADVYIVMTKCATEFVTPMLFEWATGKRPVVELSGGVEHIALAKACDSMVVVPATLNTMAKIVQGAADNSVILTAIAMLGKGKPVVVVPAMHKNLYEAAVTQEIVKKLADLGVDVLPPVEKGGRLIIPSPEIIAEKVASVTLRGCDLEGLTLLITAGPTREYIDNVRFITNPSSGLMGIALANAAYFRGASVVLIRGPTMLEPAPWIKTIDVVSTEEMADAVRKAAEEYKVDAAILAAAPADYRPREVFQGKIASGLDKLVLELVPTPKVVAELRKVFRGPIIGFAAEYAPSDEEAIERARKKLSERGFDVILVNNVAKKGIGFSSPTNEVYVVTSEGPIKKLGPARKEFLAH